MPPCHACSRPVATRWERCPWCKARQLRPYNERVATLDAWLDTLRNYGATLSVWIGGMGVMLYLDDMPGMGALVGGYAVALLVTHLVVPWTALAWRAAEVLWGLGAVLALAQIAARKTPAQAAVLAVAPVLALALMWKGRRPLMARLTGEALPEQARPEPPRRFGGCEVCGERDASLVAPLWCVSVIVMSQRWVGDFRRLCSHHALVYALPATLCSSVLGWWGLPWGVLWTCQAIVDNLMHGGVEIDSSLLRELRSDDPLHGKWISYVPPIAVAVGLFLVPLGLLALMTQLGP